MKLSRTLSTIAIIGLNVLLARTVVAQDSVKTSSFFKFLPSLPARDRAQDVMQDNEFVVRGEAVGTFLSNPLQLNGHTLDYAAFSLQSKGELTLAKRKAVTAELTQIPFYVYLRRNGSIIQLPAEVKMKRMMKIDIDTVLKYAKPGDQLIIDPANKEDWQAKRILKLLEGGC